LRFFAGSLELQIQPAWGRGRTVLPEHAQPNNCPTQPLNGNGHGWPALREMKSQSPSEEIRKFMKCSECRDLYRTFEHRRTHFQEARSAAFFLVSPRIAVRKHVDLQRAASDLYEHQAECPWAIAAEQVGRRVAH
jgi:hypothetical protein